MLDFDDDSSDAASPRGLDTGSRSALSVGADDGVNPGAYSVIAVLEYRRPKRRYWDPSKSVYVHELVQRWQFDAGVGSTVVYFRMGQRWWCAVDSAVYLESSTLHSRLSAPPRPLSDC